MDDQDGAAVQAEASFAFVDLSGFTALTEVHGDGHAAALVGRFMELAQQSCVESARVVKGMGDAVMLVADTPSDALATVVALVGRCAREPLHPVVRAGLHHGPAARVGDDYIGTTVNVAARLAADAGAGRLLADASLGHLVETLGLPMRALPARTLRNVSGTIDLIEVQLDGDDEMVVDPVCRMRIEPVRAEAWLRADDQVLWFCSQHCATRYLVEAQRT